MITLWSHAVLPRKKRCLICLPVAMARGQALSGMKTSEARLTHSRFSHFFARKTAYFNPVFNTDVCSKLKCSNLARVVQKTDNAIRRINHYPADKF